MKGNDLWLTHFCTLGIESENQENASGKRHTFAPLESNRKTMKISSGKRPPDEARGPGKEAIKPQRPGEVAKRGCTLARCSSSGSKDYADSKDKATLLHLWNPIEKPWKALRASVPRTRHRSAFQNSAKCCQSFSHCAVLFSIVYLFFSIMVQISPGLI